MYLNTAATLLSEFSYISKFKLAMVSLSDSLVLFWENLQVADDCHDLASVCVVLKAKVRLPYALGKGVTAESKIN